MKPIYKKCFTTIAVWACCFILFSFVYMLLFVPQQKVKRQIEKRLAEKKQMYESVLKTAQEEPKIRLIEEIERLRNSLGDFVVDFEGSANLIFDIGQIANEQKLDSFKIGSKGGGRGSEIPNCKYIGEDYIDINFAADFGQFATFLNALERHRPVIFVDGFTITRSDRGDTGHQVDMKLSVFIRKQQES